MTRPDVAKMFYMVKAAYPRMFKDYGETEVKNYIDAWCMVFSDISAEQGFAGLKVYLSTEKTGFPPSPGQIMDCIHRLTPDDIPNEMAAWSLVDKAVRNSNYNADEEFEKLPQIVRRAVRNPARLKEWAQMDVATYQTVEQSNFMRTYRAEVENERKNLRIPLDIRPQLEMIPDPAPRIETKVEHEKSKTPDAEIEAMIERLRA
jgi:hypothetical protein